MTHEVVPAGGNDAYFQTRANEVSFNVLCHVLILSMYLIISAFMHLVPACQQRRPVGRLYHLWRSAVHAPFEQP